MLINAGKYRHSIVIQEPTKSTDAWGGEINTWSNFATVRAKKRPLRGRELIAAQAEQSETEVMFYIRYLSGVDRSMRIVHDSKYYDITSVVNVDERNRELEISTKTGMSEG